MRLAFLTIPLIVLLTCSCNRSKENLMKQVEKEESSIYVNDIKFLNDAHNAVMMNVFLGSLAQRNARSEIVKQLAGNIMGDCCLSHAELKRIALYKKIKLPDDLCAEKQEQYDAFAKVSGKAFDKAFMKYILKEHHASLALFEEEAIKGSIADLRAWAESEAGITRHRLEIAQVEMDRFESPN